MLPVETFLWGFLGSSAVELMSLFGFYTSRRGILPSRYRKAGFWVTRFVLALVAGAVAVAYGIEQRILAFNVGAATPLIITLMAKGLRQVPLGDAPPTARGERVDGDPTRGRRVERNPTGSHRRESPSR